MSKKTIYTFVRFFVAAFYSRDRFRYEAQVVTLPARLAVKNVILMSVAKPDERSFRSVSVKVLKGTIGSITSEQVQEVLNRHQVSFGGERQALAETEHTGFQLNESNDSTAAESTASDQQVLPPTSSQYVDELQEQLVAASIKGDKEALRQLCQNIARGVLFRTIRILNNRQDAEDAAQEVMLKVCTKISDLKIPKAFNGWLNTILINETRQVMQRNSHRVAVINNDKYLENIVENDEDNLPYECTLREEERKTIIAILDRLSVRQKEAVLLHYFDGLSVTEAANAMGISQQGVSRYLKLARDRVKQEIIDASNINRSTMGNLSVLPAGALLGLALQQELTQALTDDTQWVNKVMSSCSEYIGIAVAGAVAAKTTFSSAIGTAVAIISAISISVSAWMAGTGRLDPFLPLDLKASATQPSRTIPVNHTYMVSREHAVEQNQATVVNWWITSEKSDAILYAGEGGSMTTPDDLLPIEGSTSRFLIHYTMKNPAGGNFTMCYRCTITYPYGESYVTTIEQVGYSD